MRKDEKEARKMYNDVAKFYHNYRTKENPQGWFYNEFLDMPAMLKALGKVKGKKILDFGCGTGIYAKILTKKGAKVSGFDISEEMIKIAKKENPKLNLKVGTGYKIPFKEKFDIVISSLTLFYLDDWNKVFKEVKQVLKKNGLFIFSLDNPVTAATDKIIWKKKKARLMGIKDYYKEGKQIRGTTIIAGIKLSVPYYHKTYESIIRIIIKNNFEIVDYIDAQPLIKSKKLFPKEYLLYSKIPKFCVWKLKLK